jgi:hypothetical protein
MIPSTSLISPFSKNDSPLCSTTPHFGTEQTQRNGKKQYAHSNGSLLSKALCVSDLEDPRRDRIQKAKRRNIFQAIDQQQRIRSNRKILFS